MRTGIKQSIADQSGNFGFVFNVSASDLTKHVSVGFSGAALVHWNLYQGKIYDNTGKYCGSYNPNQNVSLSGQIGSSTYDYYINNEIVCIGASKPTGIINYFYINSDTGNFVNFTSQIFGSIPNYSISNNINFYTGSPATGSITNNSQGNFKIFSGSGISNIIATGNAPGNIAPSNSGIFLSYISGATVGSSYSGNYTFYTNFGVITSPIIFNALLMGNPYTQFTYANNFNGISGAPLTTGTNAGYLGILTFSGLSFINAPFINISLLSTGNGASIPITGSIPSTGNGSIVASGYITGSNTFSGLLITEISGYGGIPTNLYSGIGSGIILETVYYTGLATQNYYAIYASGVGTGYINPYYTSLIIGSGYGFFSGNGTLSGSGYFPLTGFNFTGSGIYVDPTGGINLISGNINTGYAYLYISGTGIHNISTGIYTSGTGYFGNVPYIFQCYGYINPIFTGLVTTGDFGQITLSNYTLTGSGSGIFSANGDASTNLMPIGSFSGQVYDTIIGSGFNIQPIYGTITGLSTGFLYYKSFTGSWDLGTGINSSSMIDFKQNNWYTASGFTDGTLINFTGNSLYIQVSYIPYSDYLQDIAILSISGLNTGISIRITGQRI